MAYKQKKKQLIDVGEVGNANTGDIIFDGGNKLNDTVNALYNTFGDTELQATAEGVGNQTLHATGYYQRRQPNEYGNIPVEIGSMHDLDTTASTFAFLLPDAKRGEMVEVVNSNGSFGINSIMFRPSAGGDIDGSSELKIGLEYSHILFTCIGNVGGSTKWKYKLSPMFGDFYVPINETIEVSSATESQVALFHEDLYDVVKLLVSGVEGTTKQKTVSEILLLIDDLNHTIYSDEYSIISTGDKLYTISFEVLNKVCIAKITTTKSRINFSIKTIETIK